MDNSTIQLVYLVDSAHHLWLYKARRILEWIITNQAASTKYLLASNFNTLDFVNRLPAEMRSFVMPVFPFQNLKSQSPSTLAALIPMRPFENLAYPEESIRLYDILFPDRLVYYLNSVGDDASIQTIFSEYSINQVHLIGSSSDNPVPTFQLVQAIKARQIPLAGYPIANVVGRYAPSWLNACDQVFVEREQDVTALHHDQFFSGKVSPFNPPKLQRDQPSATSEQIIFDVGIHTPRHDLVRLLRQQLLSTAPENILIHTHLAPAFVGFLQKYLTAHSLPPIAVGNYMPQMFTAKKILSLFPFSAYYLLQDFAGNFPIYAVDLQRRYGRIDGLRFAEAELMTRLDPLPATPVREEESPARFLGIEEAPKLTNDSLANKKCLIFTAQQHHYQKLQHIIRKLTEAGVSTTFLTSQNGNNEFSGDFELPLLTEGIAFQFLLDYFDESLMVAISREKTKCYQAIRNPEETAGVSNFAVFSDLGFNNAVHELAENYILLQKAFEQNKPDFVLILHESNFWTKLVAYLAHKLAIPVFSFQEGFYAADAYDAPRVRYFTEFSDRLFLWGDDIRQSFLRYVDRPEKLAVVGAPHTDVLHEALSQFDRARFCAEYGLAGSKKIITLMLPYETETLEEIIGNFAKLVRFLEAQGLIKFRPATNFDQYTALQKAYAANDLHFFYNEDPYPMLMASDAVITGNSSVGFEAILLGAPLIYLDIAKHQDFYNYQSVALSTVTLLADDQTEFHAVKEAIHNISPQYRKRAKQYIEQRYTGFDGKVTDRIVSMMGDFLANYRAEARPTPPHPADGFLPNYVEPAQSEPTISVIIPCYNYARYLPEAVNSVLAQTYQDFEIIIVNDGSTDETEAVAEQLISANPDHSIRLISQPNSGQPAISRNVGIAAARGAYILCLDADDMLAPTMLEACLDVLRQDETIAIAYTDRLDFDGVDQVVQAGEYNFERLKVANHISYCALYEKEVWETVGGYRTNLKGIEDWDFWVAAGARGFRGYRIPQPLFKYRRHDTGVFQEVRADYLPKFAQLVLNNQELYRPQDIQAASKLLVHQDVSGGKVSLGFDRLNPRPDAKRVEGRQQPFNHLYPGVPGLSSAQKPLVSVIIPTHNRPAMLREAVESVLAQTYPSFEIIIVNDGGQDVKDLLQDLERQSPITYVRYHHNRGRSVARNTAIRLAGGKYIAYLDDDDIFYPDHLETLVQALETSNLKVAYTDAYQAHQVKEGTTYRTIKKDLLYSIEFSRDLLLVQNISPTLCFMHEKACLDEVGLFDELLDTHEDWDLWIRLSQKYDFQHIKKVTCEFRHRTDGSSTTSYDRPDFLRTMKVIFDKYKDFSQRKPKILEIQKIRLHELEAQVASSGNSPKVSIIIPVFNKAELTRNCLAALYKNSGSHSDFEVIIIDNASVDSTPHYLTQMQAEHLNMRTVTNARNQGFAKACNQGAQIARGQYLLFLNNDTEVQSGWLESIIQILDADTTVAAVGSKLVFPNGHIQHAGVAIFEDRQLPDPLVARHAYYQDPMNCPEVNQLCTYQALTAACLLIRKSAFEAVDGFDEGYWNGYEDVDLCFKLQQQGWRLVYQPHSVVIHYESQSGPERFRQVEHNINRLHNKWLGRVLPDFVIEENGQIKATAAHHIQPYRTAGPSSSISITIFTHNRPEYTRLCLERIASHIPQPHEITLVDNDSSDETVAAHQEYVANHNHVQRMVKSDDHLNGIADSGSGVKGDNESDGDRISDRLVSIIILTHNQLEHTKLCLESIAAHTPQLHELILVDNGSTDGTLDYLRAYAGKHPAARLIANAGNRGFAAGNNQGLAQAKGDYVLLLNNDTVVTAGWLDRLLAVLDRHPQVGLVGPMSNHVSGPQYVPNAAYTNLAGLHRFAGQWAADHAGQSLEFIRLVGFCLLVRRAVIEAIGGLDEQFGFGNFEDDDFCLRAVAAGFKARIAQEVFIHHTGGQTFKEANIDYLRSLENNWQLFKTKWHLPAHLPYGTDYRPHLQPVDPARCYIPLPTGAMAARTNGRSVGPSSFQTQPDKPKPTGGTMAHDGILNQMIASAQAAGRWQQAISLLQEAVKYAPAGSEQAELWNSLGYSCFQAKQLDEAEAAFTEGIRQNPQNMDLLSNLADFYRHHEQWDKATEYINQALRIDPDNVPVLLSLGECAIQLGAFDVAEMAFVRVKVLAPDTAGIDEILAELSGGEQPPKPSNDSLNGSPNGTTPPDDVSMAQQAANQALAKGQAVLEANDVAGAAQEFAWVTAQYPDLAAGHMALGSTLLALGRTEAAITPLRRVTELLPQLAAGYNQLGVACYRAGRQAEAETAFKQAHQLDPADLEPCLNLIDLYRSQKRLEEARGMVESALKLNPTHLEVQVATGLVNAEIGNFAGAWRTLVELEGTAPSHPGVAALRSLLNGQTGQSPDLLAQIETAQATGNWPPAITMLKVALTQPGHQADPTLWNSLGVSYFQDGQIGEAETALAHGLKLDPENLDILSNLADLYLQQEQFDRATEYVNKALRIDPNHVEALIVLGHCCIQLGVFDTALTAFRQVQALAPDTEGIELVVAELESLAVTPV